MKKTFNIYCDESCHLENDGMKYLFLGSVSVAYNQVKLHTDYINELKKKHSFYAEIKWTNVSKSKIRFYLDLVDYFFATDLQFRTIGVEKARINNEAFAQTYDDFYYKMYYYLLNHNISSLSNYNVYLDIKDTLSAYKVNKLKTILNIKYGVFRNVQNIRSHESIIMQLADFFMGAVSYLHNNEEHKNIAKMQIIEKMRKHCKEDLLQTNVSSKMNVFFIELK